MTNNPRCQDSSCGWGSSDVYRQSAGMNCKFPFIYKGVTYDSCTSEDHFMPWCPTSLNYAGEVVAGTGNWGNCADNCFGAHLSFPCEKLPTCCAADWGDGDLYQPPVISQATHIVGVVGPEDRDAVMEDVFSLDARNELNSDVQAFSALKTMFLADLNPVEVGFLLNDTRVTFVECNGIVTTQTKKQGKKKDVVSNGSADQDYDAAAVSMGVSTATIPAVGIAAVGDAGDNATPTPTPRRLRAAKK